MLIYYTLYFFYYTLLFETQYIQVIHIILWCLRPVCEGLHTGILDLCKAFWLAIVNLRTYEHLDVQQGIQNDHSCFHAIIHINFTIMLIISNVWAGFCWKKSWHPRCSSIHAAAQYTLFTLFDYYADYFSYYTHYFKIQTAFRVSIHCVNPPPWFPEATQKQQIIRGDAEAANHHSQAAWAKAANHR